jgi:hypothetical protein
MRRAKASPSTETIYQRWTEILSKLSAQFAEKIWRPEPLMKSVRRFAECGAMARRRILFKRVQGSGRY